MTGATPLTPEPLPAILREGSPSPALIRPDDGIVVSHGELASAVHQLAGVLAGVGVPRAQRVALVLPNGPEIVELLLAVALCGATAAPMNPGYTEAEYKFYLNDPSLLVVQAGRGADVRRAAGELMIADVAGERDPTGQGQAEAGRDPQHVGLALVFQVRAQLGARAVHLIAAHGVQLHAGRRRSPGCCGR